MLGIVVGLLGLAAASPVVEKDGTWVEVKTPAFVVLTDAGASSGRRIAGRFERIRAALETVLPAAKAANSRPVIIVAARDEGSLRSLLPGWWEKKEGVRPAAVHIPSRDQVLIVLRVDSSDTTEDASHLAYWGYASNVLESAAPYLPFWLRKGLADFYARTTVRDDAILVGRTASWHVDILRQRGLIPVASLFAVGHDSPEYVDEYRRERIDAESWALVHYLMIGDKAAHRPAMANLLAALGRGVPAGAATREALGDFATLDRQLTAYLRNRAFYMEKVPAQLDLRFETQAERRLSAAEALALRGRIHFVAGRKVDARASLEAALRLNLNTATAHEGLAALALDEDDPATARREVEEALRLDPGLTFAQRMKEGLAGPQSVKGTTILCETGDLAACANLGQWLIAGTGVPQDAEKGLTLLQRACDGGDTVTCGSLAWRLLEGEGVTSDVPRGVAILEKLCSAGDDQACLSAATRLMSGRGLAAAPERGAALLSAVCDRGSAVGCTSLAWAVESGLGMAKDMARAAALHQKACDAKEATSCTRLAFLYLRGDGVPTDNSRARELLSSACAQGDTAACSHVEAMDAAPKPRPKSSVRRP